MRAGKIIHLVEERLGEHTAKIMSAILYLGHVKISDLEKMHHLIAPDTKQDTETNGVNGVHADEESAEDEEMGVPEEQEEVDAKDEALKANGDHDDDGAAISQLHSSLRQLAGYGYILRVREAHFHSPADNFQSAARQAKASAGLQGLKGKKLEEAIKENAEAMVKEWTDGKISGVRPNALPRGIKRRVGTSQSEEPSRKRVKLDSDVAKYEDEESDLDEEDYTDDVAPMDVSYPIYRLFWATQLIKNRET